MHMEKWIVIAWLAAVEIGIDEFLHLVGVLLHLTAEGAVVVGAGLSAGFVVVT